MPTALHQHSVGDVCRSRFRFDWPLADDAPNVKPRIAGLLAAARVAGYTPVLTPNGEFELPQLKWADEKKPGAVQRLRLSRAKAPIPGPIPDATVRNR